MNVVGLFAGIGGIELGFGKAGFKTLLLSENDPTAAAILKQRFDADVVGDVALLGDLPNDTDIVTAGFPCQNLSMAGDKSGINGSKSGVVSELMRLLQRSQVGTVVIENVYFMLHLGGGTAMEWLVSQLEALHYAWAYRVLDTMGFGLPQRRRRVYLVASKHFDPRGVLLADEREKEESLPVTLKHPLGFYWTEGRSGVGLTVDGIPPLKGGSGLGIPSAPAVLFPDGAVLMPSLAGCEQIQGFERGWTSRPVDERDRRPEWRLIGNAVSVPVAEWVASRIASPRDPLDLPTRRLDPGDAWPSSAYNVGVGRFAVEASARPISRPPASIAQFRSRDWPMLSDRALNGFVKRAKAGGLRFPAGFLAALIEADRRKIAA